MPYVNASPPAVKASHRTDVLYRRVCYILFARGLPRPACARVYRPRPSDNSGHGKVTPITLD